ncbi:transposase family protein (plasmid) [Borreliella burgdorferi 64b]|nr:transposase family protein [Borreliella burgdorferi 64b]
MRIVIFLEKLKKEIECKDFLSIKVRKIGKLIELIINKNSIRIENGYIKLPKIGFVKEYNLLTLELFSSASRKDYY